MQLYLDSVNFESDFFVIDTPDGGLLRLNKIDESLNVSSLIKDVVIKKINIEIESPDGIIQSCPSVIGLGNNLMIITTEHKELEGEVLTADNMQYCTITVYEEQS